MRHLVLPAACGLTLLALAAGPAGAEQVITIDTRPGVTQSFIFVEPPGRPVADLVLFPGASGRIGLWRDPKKRNDDFLVRTRGLFAAQGFDVAVIDSPSDRHKEGLAGWRGSDAHRQDIAAVIRWLTAHAKRPVWLVGTSRGAISVAFLGANLPVDGLVMSSSVTRTAKRNPMTVLDAPLARISVPVLLVANQGDACPVSPPGGAQAVKARLTAAPTVRIEMFAGGDPPRSAPCRALSRHGYVGLEDKVVGAIATWIKAQIRH